MKRRTAAFALLLTLIAGALSPDPTGATVAPPPSDLGAGPAVSDYSTPDPWAMFVNAHADANGLTYERADDQIDAFFRCAGVRGCRPELVQWRRLALEAGWPESDHRWLWCTMGIESNGDPDAEYRGTKRRPEWSIGLLQLNTRGSLLRWFTDRGLTRESLFDPLTNLQAGREMFEARGGQPWGGRCKR